MRRDLCRRVENQKQIQDAEELQRYAERHDMAPIYNYIKAIRGKSIQTQDKNIMIANDDGKKAKDIKEENVIIREYDEIPITSVCLMCTSNTKYHYY